MSLSLEAIWDHLDSLVKPPQSLGQLEELAARLCHIQQTLSPQTSPRRLVLFAADHGVVEAGVTAWPSKVTELMIQNICAGRAASTVLARQSDAEAVLINVGTFNAVEPVCAAGGGGRPLPSRSLPDFNAVEPACAAGGARYEDRRIRPGTRNLALEPAMTVKEFHQALAVGSEAAREAAEAGVRIVAAGEMGIGNTTPAACLAMLLADVPLRGAVGPGAGADAATVDRKRRVVDQAVRETRQRWAHDPTEAIAAVAGLELVAMAGFFLEAHRRRLTILLDGFIATAAALIAHHLEPETVHSMIAAHRSAEPGHGRMLEHLKLAPMLDWRLRLGEGTGALLLLPLLDAAAAMTTEMARLEEMQTATEEPV